MTASAVHKSRLDRGDRRGALLDAAAAIVSIEGADAVTMESVAERSGVSRPLVYKHFANRAELLEALYEREARAWYRQISAAVGEAKSLEDMFRALVRGSLAAQTASGATFAALRAAGGRGSVARANSRARDGRTLRYFVGETMRRFDLSETQARAAVSVLLGAIDSVLNVFRVRPTPEHAALLEDTYVTLVTGGLAALKGSPA